MDNYFTHFEEILDIIKKLRKETNTYTQDEIVDFIVGIGFSEWGLKEDEVPVFKAWVQGIVRTYFYFKK